jgi:hypothetical protein
MHRLMTGRRQIDNRQAAMTHADTCIDRPPFAAVVRTAMRHAAQARREPGAFSDWRCPREAGYAAHGLSPVLDCGRRVIIAPVSAARRA